MNRQTCFGGPFCTFLQRPVAAYIESKRFNRSFLPPESSLGQNIRPRSTVLWVTLDRQEKGVNAYQNALGLLSSRAIVDLGNYEASADHFLTRWRPERDPWPALGTEQQLAEVPPVFDIVRYEKETQGRVDYILFEGGAGSGGDSTEGLEAEWYRERIANYTLVSSAQRGRLRLYRRKSAAATASIHGGTVKGRGDPRLRRVAPLVSISWLSPSQSRRRRVRLRSSHPAAAAGSVISPRSTLTSRSAVSTATNGCVYASASFCPASFRR